MFPNTNRPVKAPRVPISSQENDLAEEYIQAEDSNSLANKG
jgi:hypothetical protein